MSARRPGVTAFTARRWPRLSSTMPRWRSARRCRSAILSRKSFCSKPVSKPCAPGLTSSSCEMGARAGNGVELNLDLVPQRELNMTAYEMMLSESQERMLIVAKPGHENQVADIFRKWDLDVATIGRVIAEPKLRVWHKGELVADIPNKALTDEAPRYNRPMAATAAATAEDVTPKVAAGLEALAGKVGNEQLMNEVLLRLLAAPNIASKQWVYRQYDHMV